MGNYGSVIYAVKTPLVVKYHRPAIRNSAFGILTNLCDNRRFKLINRFHDQRQPQISCHFFTAISSSSPPTPFAS
jgi:hypothetical protein